MPISAVSTATTSPSRAASPSPSNELRADIDREAAVDFLRTGYHPEDWIAVLVKAYDTGWVAQRVGPVSLMMSARFLDWLRRANDVSANIYVSVNAVRSGQLTRTRRAIADVRHVFVDADHSAAAVIAAINGRLDLPEPSYVLHSSPGRAHVLWRVAQVSVAAAESLQKQLARALHTDPAATAASQMTRLPGFFNRKYSTPSLVTIDYRCWGRVYTGSDFPTLEKPTRMTVANPAPAGATSTLVMRRAAKYLDAIPPAVAGHHGDLHTFRVCCRLVRGFALSDPDALHVLRNWNLRCDPPWSERELRQKLWRARRYGREPIGGLLHANP
jgi:hypothetical protein